MPENATCMPQSEKCVIKDNVTPFPHAGVTWWG